MKTSDLHTRDTYLQAASDTSNGAGHTALGGNTGGITPSGAHGRGPRLYVGGVPDEITEEDIIQHFNKWGNVVDVYFPGKKGAKRVNYCFVTYDNWRSAQRACNQSERNIDGKVSQVPRARLSGLIQYLTVTCL